MFQAMVTRLHSARTRNWWNPITDLMMPNGIVPVPVEFGEAGIEE
jgi:hypothetical protein